MSDDEKMAAARSHCPHVVTAQSNTWHEVLEKGKNNKCEECRSTGPNLWICLYNDCLFLGCGEATEYDHSTEHAKNEKHPLTMNVTTNRIWCYECECEVFRDRNQPPFAENMRLRTIAKVTPYEHHSTSHQHRTPQSVQLSQHRPESLHANMAEAEMASSSEEEEDETVKPRGLAGLQNIGNTCYMNSALQSLSNCPPLTRFFLDCDGYVLGDKKPKLARHYQRLVQEMWSKRRPSYLTPSSVANSFKIIYPMFRGYSQQDSQEFLRCFMDQLHEDLKQPLPPPLSPLSTTSCDDTAGSHSDSSAPSDDEQSMTSSRRHAQGQGSPQQATAPIGIREATNSNASMDVTLARGNQSDCGVGVGQSEDEYETCDSGLSSDRSSMQSSVASYEEAVSANGSKEDSTLVAEHTEVVSKEDVTISENFIGEVEDCKTTTPTTASSPCMSHSVSIGSESISQNTFIASNKLPSVDSGIQCMTSSLESMQSSTTSLSNSQEGGSLSSSNSLTDNKINGRRPTNDLHDEDRDNTVALTGTAPLAQVHTLSRTGGSRKSMGDNRKSTPKSSSHTKPYASGNRTSPLPVTQEDAREERQKNNAKTHVSDNTRSKSVSISETGDSSLGDNSGETGVRTRSSASESQSSAKKSKRISRSMSECDNNTSMLNQGQMSRSHSAAETSKVRKQQQKAASARLRKGKAETKKKPREFQSVISDVFDGRILSSVQCLTCERISMTKETFQDISLPIPSREHMRVLATQPQAPTQRGVSCTETAVHTSWLGSMFGWMRSWFWGPAVTLQNCLAAFFSADELKGDNMYSCEKCKKLRNGVKYSKVLKLPEILCIHLKRFRHEFYSSKIGTYVSFPLYGLDMKPYLHKDCTDKITEYDLVAVICHHGTAGGGHYTSYGLNDCNHHWYEFDDQCVTEVDMQQVENCEAYVLFYRKKTEHMFSVRQKATDLHKATDASLMRFWVSRQWINRFNTFAEPGPISNHDFICSHGGVYPSMWSNVSDLAMEVQPALWQFWHKKFGGGPVVTHLNQCSTCLEEEKKLRHRQDHERDTFTKLHDMLEAGQTTSAIYAISLHWFKQWENFVRLKTDEPPGPIENQRICTVKQGKPVLRHNADYGQVSEETWRFLFDIYGGGPDVITRPAADQ